MSQVYEDEKGNDEELTRPLKEEIEKLKDIVSELEGQMGQRSDHFTFR